MKKIDLALLFGLVISIIITSITAFADDCNNIKNNVFRLHILANSNSMEDQNLKLQIRDAVLLHTNGLFAKAHTKEEIEALTQENLDYIEDIAKTTIANSGYNYSVHAQIVNMYFNTRKYTNMTLPAGRYDALRITIGSGVGENWWCMMFPPMCIPAAEDSDSKELRKQIQDLEEKPNYKPAFAVVEIIEDIENSLDNLFN